MPFFVELVEMAVLELPLGEVKSAVEASQLIRKGARRRGNRPSCRSRENNYKSIDLPSSKLRVPLRSSSLMAQSPIFLA